METDFFKKSMTMLLHPDTGATHLGEEDADKQLVIAASNSMTKKLNQARGDGRHGWWDADVCSIDDLYALREQALAEDDHISTLNFTAMIAMRQSVAD